MNVQDCIKTRRSVRRYRPDPVPQEVLRGIVETVAYAPSWKNTQTTRYLVIQDPALKSRIAQEAVTMFPGNQRIIEGAPALVVVTTIASRSGYERDGSFSTSKGTHWESFDCGIATQTFCLAAWDAGLGTVVMGIFDEEKVASLAEVPQGQKVSALVAIGYPDETPAAPKRKAVDDLLTIR